MLNVQNYQEVLFQPSISSFDQASLVETVNDVVYHGSASDNSLGLFYGIIEQVLCRSFFSSASCLSRLLQGSLLDGRYLGCINK